MSIEYHLYYYLLLLDILFKQCLKHKMMRNEILFIILYTSYDRGDNMLTKLKNSTEVIISILLGLFFIILGLLYYLIPMQLETKKYPFQKIRLILSSI